MPAIIADDNAADEVEPYPQPALWYLATGKRYVGRYSDSDWADYWAGYQVSMANDPSATMTGSSTFPTSDGAGTADANAAAAS